MVNKYLNESKCNTKIYIPSKIKGGVCYCFIKRVFDIIFSFLTIVILSPLLISLALLVKCTSKGPILFRDKRIGKNGIEIKVLKFRSMFADAEEKIKEYLTPEEYKNWLINRKIDNDPRITKIGKFMRNTSLDELPQLFNVLNGTLSFIGWRPIALFELNENYTEEQKKYLFMMKPGLSGNWAAHGRSDISYDNQERQKLELQYLEKRSILYDIKLMFLTILIVMQKRGAK